MTKQIYEQLLGERVEVYWNRGKKVWSMRHRGHVVGHFMNVGLQYVAWVVQPGGRARVIRDKQKNVHAFARGTLTLDMPTINPNGSEVFYNPYIDTCFRTKSDVPVDYSHYAYMTVGEGHLGNPRPEAHAIGVIR